MDSCLGAVASGNQEPALASCVAYAPARRSRLGASVLPPPHSARRLGRVAEACSGARAPSPVQQGWVVGRIGGPAEDSLVRNLSASREGEVWLVGGTKAENANSLLPADDRGGVRREVLDLWRVDRPVPSRYGNSGALHQLSSHFISRRR